MSVRIVIPVRPFGEGKSRLAKNLSAQERVALSERMFRHVLRCAQQVAPTYVVSSDPAVLALAAHAIPDAGQGLNAALEQAVATLEGQSPVLVLFADLPLLETDDLYAMIAGLEDAMVVAAADKTGTGTNALLLARPKLIPYAFGENSLSAHERLADEHGYRFLVVRRPGLALDMDMPDDLGVFVTIA